MKSRTTKTNWKKKDKNKMDMDENEDEKEDDVDDGDEDDNDANNLGIRTIRTKTRIDRENGKFLLGGVLSFNSCTVSVFGTSFPPRHRYLSAFLLQKDGRQPVLSNTLSSWP